MGLLEGKTAVVTGGAQGIGFAIAQVLASEGARLVLGDKDLDGASRAARILEEGGAVAVAQSCDVTSESDVQALISRAGEEFGAIDVLVNNAGITRDATLRTMTIEDFRAVIDVHLLGAWLGSKYASLVMREQRRGTIVNISSISGKVGFVGQSNYSAAKAGMIGLTKAAAKELGHLGIRVNAVQPGLIRTAMTEALSPEIFAQKVAEVPMGRAGEAQEVANAVLFLASELSSYITGAVLEVTGGRYM